MELLKERITISQNQKTADNQEQHQRKRGLSYLTVTTLSEYLGIRKPSLYNHVKTIDDVHYKLMIYGWKKASEELVAGIDSDNPKENLINYGRAFYRFAMKNPGVFEAMLWYNKYSDDSLLEATEGLYSFFFEQTDNLSIDREVANHLLRTYRAFRKDVSMKKLYEKNEILFAVICIVLYCAVMTTLKGNYGYQSIIMLLGISVFAICISLFVKVNHLEAKCRIASWPRNTKQYLYFIPMLILATGNIWDGFALSYHGAEQVFAVVSMIIVGFVEEMLFRGFLFTAMLSKGRTIVAIIVSSLTFGMGHIINLFAGQTTTDSCTDSLLRTVDISAAESIVFEKSLDAVFFAFID